MAAPTAAAETANHRVLAIARVLDAPRSLVWKAWAEPERMVRWLGPRGFTGKILKFDGQPGGTYRFQMRGPDGVDRWVQGVYREVIEAVRLVYTWTWTDAQGRPEGPETTVTVSFEDYGTAQTKLTLRQIGFDSIQSRDAHQQGWDSTFDRLADLLAA
jgi:uncharacterized protein YndB with AHSA1/START domain